MNANQLKKHLPSAVPEMAGPLGKAWRLNLQTIAANLRANSTKEIQLNMLESWIVYSPSSHPFWPCYHLMISNLRPDESGEPFKIYLPGATHEMHLLALNPDQSITLDQFPNYLEPINFAAQMIETSDEAAVLKIKDAVSDILHGRLNPDTDGRSRWVERFGGNMIRG